MKSHLSIAILLGLSLATSQPVPEFEETAGVPQSPVWPSNFTASWNEETLWSGVRDYTGGSTIYKWNNGVNPQMLWARFDGMADEYCEYSLPMPYETQCQHIVTGGIRYLSYPIIKQCCQCCNDEHGCGVPPPNFMANATYLGVKMYLGRYVYSWKVSANYSNLNYTYVETASSNPLKRAWAALSFIADEYPNVWGWSKKAAKITLPTECENSQFCTGPCMAQRMNGNGPPILFN